MEEKTMSLHLTVLAASRGKTETSTMRSQPNTRRRSRIGAKFGALAIALPAVATFSAPVSPAYADAIEIVNIASGLRVDVIGASVSVFQGAFLWPDNSSASQEFDLVLLENGYNHIMARHSGQCLMLDWREGYFTNGTKVIQFPACSEVGYYLPSQWFHGWVFDDCHPNWQECNLRQRHILVNRYTKKCLDAGNSSGGAPGQRAVLQQWDCISSTHQWNAGNQLWDIVRATSRR
jgi:hypothetical protein